MKERSKKSTKVNGRNFQKKQSPLGRGIEFCLDAPEAGTVCLAGDFNGWDIRSLPLKRSRDGVWKIKKELKTGCYEYKFLTDRGWVETLPDAESVMNPFGTKNFIIRVA